MVETESYTAASGKIRCSDCTQLAKRSPARPCNTCTIHGRDTTWKTTHIETSAKPDQAETETTHKCRHHHKVAELPGSPGRRRYCGRGVHGRRRCQGRRQRVCRAGGKKGIVPRRYYGRGGTHEEYFACQGMKKCQNNRKHTKQQTVNKVIYFKIK